MTDRREVSAMKHYLSGPMTGYVAFNFPAFQYAAETLRAQGLEVMSAHEVAHPEPDGVVGSLPWAVYLRGDLKALLECDAIVMLPGWSFSKGACLEHHVALALGMPVKFFIDGQLQEVEP